MKKCPPERNSNIKLIVYLKFDRLMSHSILNDCGCIQRKNISQINTKKVLLMCVCVSECVCVGGGGVVMNKFILENMPFLMEIKYVVFFPNRCHHLVCTFSEGPFTSTRPGHSFFKTKNTRM